MEIAEELTALRKKSRAELTPLELESLRSYERDAAKRSRARKRAKQRHRYEELPAALGYLWGCGEIGERCKTARELLQSAREFAKFLTEPLRVSKPMSAVLLVLAKVFGHTSKESRGSSKQPVVQSWIVSISVEDSGAFLKTNPP